MSTNAALTRIFISYRRDDASGHAGRLYDDLAERFGDDRVFIDIDTIEPGVDFGDSIEQALDRCEVVLAVIGKSWVTITDSAGLRRLDNPDDYVRMEASKLPSHAESVSSPFECRALRCPARPSFRKVLLGSPVAKRSS